MKKLTPHSPATPKFGATHGDTTLATLKDVNLVISGLNEFTTVQSITAHAGGGQALAEVLIPGVNVVETATTGDSVVVPCFQTDNTCSPAYSYEPSAPYVIKNTGPGILNIYPCVGVAIDGMSANAPLQLASGSSVILVAEGCNDLVSYGLTIDPNTDVLTLTGCNVTEPTPGNFVIGPVTVDSTLTGTGCVGDPLSVVPGAAAMLYAEYVQHTQGANASIAPGRAILYTTDTPSGVFNTIGITTAAGPAAQGTSFNLPVGVYMVDYENSSDAAWSLAIYQGASATVLSIKNDTISGSSTATTWIHGRAIVTVTALAVDNWIMISPVIGTQAIPTAGTATGQFIARITFLKIA